jgi:hypothetical protein
VIVIALQCDFCGHVRSLATFVVGELPGPLQWKDGIVRLCPPWVQGAGGRVFCCEAHRREVEP